MKAPSLTVGTIAAVVALWLIALVEGIALGGTCMSPQHENEDTDK